MKNRCTRWVCVLVCIILVMAIAPVPIMAAEKQNTERIGTVSATYTNPFCRETESEDFPAVVDTVSTNEDIVYYCTVEEAGAAVREKMKLRQETITVGLQATYVDQQQLYDVVSAALVHTGMPDEGDYLRWQFQSWAGSIEGYAEDDTNYLTLTYMFSYYTTAEQETQVDAAIALLLSELDLASAGDYEKVRGVYDWICKNVTYDYTNLNDDAYTLKYTAYAALINRTAVCQGYANLFYRLCLELGLDCRIEYGYAFNIFGRSEAHSWNLVRVDGKYYYVDTTWGATLDENDEPDYYYLLKGPDGFRDHLKAKDPDFPALDTGSYGARAEQDYPIPEANMIVAQGQASDTATWKLSKTDVLTLSGSGAIYEMWNDTIQGWQQYRLDIKEVVVEEGITLLGRELFANSYLKAATLPDSLVTLEDGVFRETSLSVVELPAGLQELGEGAISSRCLQAITVDPENKNFSFRDGVLFSKDGKTLLIYAGVIHENDGSLIREYAIPEGVETIGANAFGGNATLTKITLPETVKYIESNAFALCSYADINFPESLVSIGEFAFKNCNRLQSIYIGKHVTSIGEGAFSWAYYFSEINVHPENEFYCSVDGVLFNKDMTTLLRYPPAKSNSTYEIPYGVTEIASFAFMDAEGRTELKSIVFPNTVVTIGEAAFQDQDRLRCLHLPDSLETIGLVAFQGLSGLDRIDIPDGVKTIDFGAFSAHCAEIIVLGKNVESIREKAFTRNDYPYQNNNEEIKVYFRGAPPAVPDWYGYSYCILFGYDPQGADSTRVLATVYYPEELTDLWAPNGETEWNPFPVELDIPTAYKIYPGEAPEPAYTSVVTAPTCQSQGYTTHTCPNCGDSYVSDYTDPVDHSYEDGKCIWCGTGEALASGICGENLTWVLTSDGVLTISGTGAMYDFGYGEAPWGDHLEAIRQVVIPDGATRIGQNAFREAVNIVDVSFSDTVTEIGNWAFMGAEKLAVILLPQNLQVIGQQAFMNCVSLKKIELPETLTFIDGGVFTGCTALTKAVIHGDPDAPSFMMGDAPFRGCTSLEAIEVDELHFCLKAIDGVLYNASGEELILVQYPAGKKDSVFEIPQGTIEIFQLSMEDVDALEEVIFPDGVQIISSFALSGCDNLHTIRFLGDAPVIQNYAFSSITATAYYPAGNETWTSDVMQNYGGTITWEPYGDGEEEYVTQWISATTSLNGTIDLNIYVALSDNILNDPNAYVRFIRNGEIVDVPVSKGIESEKRGQICYRYSCEIFAKQVADSVTIQVMNSKGAINNALEYSVMRYCVNQIKNSKDADLVSLCKALLNYASAAQVYFNHNTGNLANASLSEADKVLPSVDASAYKFNVVGSEPGIKPRSATLMLEAEVAIRVYFVVEEGYDISDFTFAIDGVEVPVQQNEKGYYIESNGIPAKELDDMHQFTVGGLTVNYGALSYVNSKAGGSNVNEANLAKALYAYYTAAEALLG